MERTLERKLPTILYKLATTELLEAPIATSRQLNKQRSHVELRTLHQEKKSMKARTERWSFSKKLLRKLHALTQPALTTSQIRFLCWPILHLNSMFKPTLGKSKSAVAILRAMLLSTWMELNKKHWLLSQLRHFLRLLIFDNINLFFHHASVFLEGGPQIHFLLQFISLNLFLVLVVVMLA